GGQCVFKEVVDRTTLYRLPTDPVERQRWLDRQAYNLFLSIEMTESSFSIVSKYVSDTPLLYWIQDPRELEMYQPRLKTVSKLKDGDWAYISEVESWIQDLIENRRVIFISQAPSLSTIARRMYKIPHNFPIADLPNPVEIDFSYTLDEPKIPNKIIFLARLEAQKRAWIFCELAKHMPQYQFYVLGEIGRGRDEIGNTKTLEPYRNGDGSSKIKNLHFLGHVEGDFKNAHIKSAKLMINTSIWEGVPISWLEVLSYGTLIVSSFDRDDLVARFGSYVGEVLGDGVDEASLSRYARAIEYWMTHDVERLATAQKAIDYIRERHSIETFTTRLRDRIIESIR
ncbi:MAG: glycosyltransferase, partial [Methylocystis sp.]